MSSFERAVAQVAAALNDDRGSTIADPRKKVYTVTFHFPSHLEAFAFVPRLMELGIPAKTLVAHDEQTGDPTTAEVRLYPVLDQKRLLETTEPHIRPERKAALDRLIRARSPIPEDVLTRMVASRRIYRPWPAIAARMNELDVMDGRGGGDWTSSKVKKAVTSYLNKAKR
jgi:hypothetical protein